MNETAADGDLLSSEDTFFLEFLVGFVFHRLPYSLIVGHPSTSRSDQRGGASSGIVPPLLTKARHSKPER